MFRYLLLSLLVANMFWKNVDGCKTSDGCIPGAIPGINLCPNNRVRRVASFDDIISELKTLEKAGGCIDEEGCEEGRKMAEVSGQEAVYMYIKTKCASTVGRDQCPKMCGACAELGQVCNEMWGPRCAKGLYCEGEDVAGDGNGICSG